MLVHVTLRALAFILAAASPAPDPVSSAVLSKVASPVLTSAQFLIPAAVAISGIHKIVEHRESGGSFLVEMVVKGGGAVLVLQLIKSLTGIS